MTEENIAPAVERQEAVQMASMPVERCYDVRAKMIIAFNEAKKAGRDLDDQLDAAYKAALRYSPAPPEYAALQSTIAQLQARVQELESEEPEWSAMQQRLGDENSQLRNRIAELEGGRPEPVEALLLSDCVEMANREYGGGYFGTDVVQLYTTPPAPVAVVLPDFDTWYAKNVGVIGTEAYKHDHEIWHACLDATAALNEVRK